MKKILKEISYLTGQKCRNFLKAKAFDMKLYPFELKNLLIAYQITFKIEDLRKKGESDRNIF